MLYHGAAMAMDETLGNTELYGVRGRIAPGPAAAVNAALTQARELSERELGKISGGLKIPGITG